MTAPTRAAKRTDRLRIDFLFLDLETCTRCRRTEHSLESALAAVSDLLAARGTAVEVNKVRVESAQHARELRFEISPTIRVNGRDLALELRESSCASDGCTDGCGGSIACRVWVYAGAEHTEPPMAMILDAILGEVYGTAGAEHEPDPTPYQLPENLERFFARTVPADPARVPMPADCCSPTEQRTCCEPEDKPNCCGAATDGACGCQ